MAYSPAIDRTSHFSPDWGSDSREMDLKSERSASPTPSSGLHGPLNHGEAQLSFRVPPPFFVNAVQAVRSAETLWDEMLAESSDKDGLGATSANRLTRICKTTAARHLERLRKVRSTTLAAIPNIRVPLMVPPSELPPAQLLQQASHGLLRHASVPVMVPPSEPPPALSQEASSGLLRHVSVPVMVPPAEPPPLELLQQASHGLLARAPVLGTVPSSEPPPQPLQQAPKGLHGQSSVPEMVPPGEPPESMRSRGEAGAPTRATIIPPWKLPRKSKVEAAIHAAPWRNTSQDEKRRHHVVGSGGSKKHRCA